MGLKVRFRDDVDPADVEGHVIRVRFVDEAQADEEVGSDVEAHAIRVKAREDDVEGHAVRIKYLDEPPADDDVEGHTFRVRFLAEDDAEQPDVEAHVFRAF